VASGRTSRAARLAHAAPRVHVAVWSTTVRAGPPPAITAGVRIRAVPGLSRRDASAAVRTTLRAVAPQVRAARRTLREAVRPALRTYRGTVRAAQQAFRTSVRQALGR
jgi:hypothetical protein